MICRQASRPKKLLVVHSGFKSCFCLEIPKDIHISMFHCLCGQISIPFTAPIMLARIRDTAFPNTACWPVSVIYDICWHPRCQLAFCQFKLQLHFALWFLSGLLVCLFSFFFCFLFLFVFWGFFVLFCWHQDAVLSWACFWSECPKQLWWPRSAWSASCSTTCSLRWFAFASLSEAFFAHDCTSSGNPG